MKIIKTLILLFTISLGLNSCDTSKAEKKGENTKISQSESQLKNLEVNISGMTCEIGCAKTIESKVSKMKGVSFSKVSYNDSIGQFTYDANLTSAKTIIAKIDGIADGDTYKVVKSQDNVTFVTKQ